MPASAVAASSCCRCCRRLLFLPAAYSDIVFLDVSGELAVLLLGIAAELVQDLGFFFEGGGDVKERKRKRPAERGREEEEKERNTSHLFDLPQVLFYGREHLAHSPLDKDVADLEERD